MVLNTIYYDKQEPNVKNHRFSTLLTSDNVGTCNFAGYNTPLFSSRDKFLSGTGWPSFASALEGGVEVEAIDPIRATWNGREVRCGTCGGHLGDLFNDGFLFVGSEVAKTGKRYCIDGAALIFEPADGSKEILGDRPPPNNVIMYEPHNYRQS